MSVPPTASTSPPRAGVNQPLRRPRDERLIAGVCAGIARTLGVPALVARIVALVVAVAIPPVALIAYAALAIAMPRDDGRLLLGGEPQDTRETIVGWALVVAALIAVAAGFESTFFGGPGGLVLLAGGLVLLVVHHQRRTGAGSDARPTAETAASAAARPAASRPARAVELPYPGPPPRREPITAVTEPLPASGPVRSPAPPPPSVPREPSVALVGIALVVAAGALGVVLHALDVIDISAGGVAIALGIGAMGLTLAAVALARRRGAVALVVIAVLLALGALGAATVGDHVEEGVGERVEYPITPVDLTDEFRLGIGSLKIDLTGAQLPPGATTIRGRLGIGELVVRVPPGVRVVSIGETRVEGLGVVNTQAGPSPSRTVRIDAHVEHGSAEVDLIRASAP